MSWKIFSLLSVTIGFLVLVVWVYLPRNKMRFERYGKIPVELDREKMHAAQTHQIRKEGAKQ